MCYCSLFLLIYFWILLLIISLRKYLYVQLSFYVIDTSRSLRRNRISSRFSRFTFYMTEFEETNNERTMYE